MTQSSENDEKEGPPKEGCCAYAIRVVLLVTVICITLPINLVLSWPAVLPKLEEDTADFTVTKEDVSWLVSVVFIIGIFVSTFAGSLLELLGPKRLVLLALLPKAAFWLLMAFTPYLSLLYLGRVGLAFVNCFLCAAFQPLLAEISTPEKRGLVAASSEIAAAAAMLIGYMLANFLSWRPATAIPAAPCMLISLLMYFVPESPYWLVRKNRIEEAERSLRRLRGPKCDVSNQLNSVITAASDNKTSISSQITQLKKRENGMPVFLLWVVFVLREYGGKNAMFSYSVYTFHQAKVEIDPFICTMILGAIRLIGHTISAFTIDYVGRKPFIGGSSLVCGLSVLVSGIFLVLELPGKSWVSLGLLLLFVISYGLGMGPIPWVYIGELLPTPVRPLGSSLMVFTYNFGGFVMNYAFFKIISKLGLGLTLVIFSVPNFFIMLIVILWLPETRGRSLEELQDVFRSKSASSPEN
ncbi:facilitated trehalose transporter Tret1-like [Macrobrachium rosenbergii]|uniref:facilitated trehalose transporter Tret1-like n=1 Tax=Macrobrachium rosenbergii TaxID=79674 RepID=UPI0034D67572